MIVGIHQPNYLPWVGFFKKMMLSDVFIILDTAQFTKNGYQNRTKIRTNDKDIWLTQPVSLSKGSFRKTNQITFADIKWKKKHLTSIRTNYGKSKNFKSYFNVIESGYQNSTVNLSGFNLILIQILKDILGLNAKIVLASDYPSELTGTERLIELIKSVNGKSYISGEGGKKYMNEKLFIDEKIELIYSKIEQVPYQQMGPGFIDGLSIIDFIFNVGTDFNEYC